MTHFRRGRSRGGRVYGSQVILIVLGVLASLCLMPQLVDEPTSLRTPAIVLSLSLAGGAILEMSAYGLARGLAAEWLLSFGIIYYVLLDLITGRYVVAASRRAMALSFVAIGLFALGATLGSLMTGSRVPGALRRLQSRDYAPRTLFFMILGCSTLGLFYYPFMAGFSLPATFAGLGESRYGAPWARGALGDWNAFYEHLTYFGYLTPNFTVLLGLRLKKWSDPRVIIGFLLSALVLAFVIQSGGRRIFGVMCGSAVLVYTAANLNRCKLRHIAVIALSLAAVIVTMEFMLDNRGVGFRNYDFSSDAFQTIRVDDNFNRLAQIVDLFPRDVPYVGSDFIVYALLRPIPRALWADKPVSPGFELHTYLGYTDVTLSVSTIAELYSSYGWSGVLMGGLLFGYLARTFTKVKETSGTLTGLVVYGLGAMMIVAGVRSLFELILMSYPLLFWIAIESVCGMFQLRRTAGWTRRGRLVAP
jgi:hypothetical protein